METWSYTKKLRAPEMTTVPLNIYFLFLKKSLQKIIESLSNSENNIAWSLQDNPYKDAYITKNFRFNG